MYVCMYVCVCVKYIYVIFAESRVKKKKKNKDKVSARVDHSHLPNTYLQYMIASLALHPAYLHDNPAEISILLIGLGGGALVMFIKKYIKNVS